MEKEKDKKEINVHIMHSMKGGCGKSTCALFKTLQIAQEHDIGDRRAHVLFLDADFKGSAMVKILFHRRNLSAEAGNPGDEREKMKEFQNPEKEVRKGDGIQHQVAIPDCLNENKTISNYLRDSARCSIKDIIWHSCSYQTVEKSKASGGTDTEENAADTEQNDFVNGYVDFILSAVSADSKDWFRHKHGRIAAGVYSYKMDALFRNILNEGVVNGEERGTYRDIVIDMPPGYDEYSDILLDILHNIAEENENIKLHYYAITTGDIGHRALTKNNIDKQIQEQTKHKPFFSVNLVLSAVSREDFSDLPDTDRMEYKSWIKGSEQGKVYMNKYSDSYHAFCREGNIGKFDQEIQSVLIEY